MMVYVVVVGFEYEGYVVDSVFGSLEDAQAYKAELEADEDFGVSEFVSVLAQEVLQNFYGPSRPLARAETNIRSFLKVCLDT